MTFEHSTDNYTIAKGVLWIAPWVGTTPPTDPGDFEDIGNAPSIELEPSVERLPHYSSRTQIRLKDKNPIIQTDYVLNFELDEPAAAQMNLFLMGNLTNGSIISALQNADAEFALKFISDNPFGKNQTWRFHRVSLAPNGPIQLIGEEYMTMAFTAEGLADTANHASSPYVTVNYLTTTTTTTV
jgi:hypothetical protein